MARRLRLRRDDRDLAADERIDQGRLADVRAPDDRHESGAERGGAHGFFLMSAGNSPISLSAATCSARRRLAPSPAADRPSDGDRAADDERLLVRVAGDPRQRVLRQREPPGLQRLLQAGLGILERARGRQDRQARSDQVAHDVERNLKIGVQVDRADHRLQGVGEDRRAPKAARLQFAAAEAQTLAQALLGGDLGQGLAAHQGRALPRQGSLIGGGMRIVEQARNGAIQHRVAEELEPLVVVGARAAVRERGRAERESRERVAEFPADPGAHVFRRTLPAH